MPASTRNATLIGASAVFMWGMLALLTTLTGKVPPFLLAALAFGTATVFVTLKWLLRGEDIRAHLHQPPRVWLLGVSGLFGYHFFYFVALRNAPAVEASLIAYLWPLLIVVLSALLPGEGVGTSAGASGRRNRRKTAKGNAVGVAQLGDFPSTHANTHIPHALIV